VGGLGPSQGHNFGLKSGGQARGTEDRDAECIKRGEEYGGDTPPH